MVLTISDIQGMPLLHPENRSRVVVAQAPPVLVQEVAARLTNPVSDTGQAVVLVDTLAGATTMPMVQEATFEVTLDEMLPPAKLLVVVVICVRPPVETEDVMVGEPDDAIMVM